MTSALDFAPPGGLTTDDLDAMPEDGRRRELIDGVLHLPPHPTPFHQNVCMRLAAQLDAGSRDGMVVVPAVEVRLSNRRSFIPDIVVLTGPAFPRDAAHLAPHEVVLAIEVVSPFTVTIDRILKPALYASAGIAFYWLVETDGPISVTTFQLDPINDVYRPIGIHRDSIVADQPWPVDIPISSLTRL